MRRVSSKQTMPTIHEEHDRLHNNLTIYVRLLWTLVLLLVSFPVAFLAAAFYVLLLPLVGYSYTFKHAARRLYRCVILPDKLTRNIRWLKHQRLWPSVIKIKTGIAHRFRSYFIRLYIHEPNWNMLRAVYTYRQRHRFFVSGTYDLFNIMCKQHHNTVLNTF